MATVVLGATLGAPAGAQTSELPPEVPDELRAYSIVPPGQDGYVGPTLEGGEHFDDQLDTYASLIDDDDVTEAELDDYFHSMQFGTDEVEAGYEPTTGVTVYRDTLGIPHIYAGSMNQASFALGYVTAEDRMFQMDVFRHAARGDLAEFLGSGTDDAFLKMDKDTRRNGYTLEEVEAMLAAFDDKFGATGVAVQEGIEAYADGVNAYIDELKTTKANEMPVEYAATGNPPPVFPEEWSATDTAYLAILQLRVFGETAGGELENAAFLAHLRKRLGKRKGMKVYDDLLFQNDPRSPVSIAPGDGDFSTQRLGKLDSSSVAIPDEAEALGQEQAAMTDLRAEVLGSLGFRAPASNALLVSGEKSATGNPLQIGAPQVGYGVPSFFMDVDVHAPGVDFRGPAVPGASALIPLGRGADYAWSLTTGYSDAVDTRVELLCDPAGGEPTGESNGYLFDGECVAMESREETYVVKPTPTSPEPPRVETDTIYRTLHGPVIGRGTVKGKPVAFVKERFFWERELDSIPQFYRWNTEVDSIDDFAAAAKDFTMSFNAFYADAHDIGYFHVGFYPRRTRGTSPSLPTWGTGEWEWRGRRRYAAQPQVVNPEQGWVANWNNKPSASWDNYDGFKWGSVQRMELLSDRMHELFDGGGRAELSDLVDVIRDAATRDTRGAYLAPRMFNKLGKSIKKNSGAHDALGVVKSWARRGAHRFNRDGNDTMDESAALLLFDRWYELMTARIFDDELGRRGYELIGAPVTDYRPNGGSSFWFDFSSYSFNLFGRRSRKLYERNYCDVVGTRKLERCKGAVVGSFRQAYKELVAEQGDDLSAWSADAENITFEAFGAGSVDPIPWQNRGTHNHVVEVLGSD
ncbi:MAG: penicillin acylase family protein [Actinomycetota bacterium]